MFYSHEVLTSRQYGIATVWLVATLGAHSHSKKVNRKAITEVDVGRACKTIVDPVAPMALRLQGNLLYGVSRVYLQQCGYVLSDAQNAYNAMHIMLRAVKNAALDPEAGRARPEQLLLQDDPSFMPEFALPPPELLAELDLGPPLEPLFRNGDSQSLTPFGSQQGPTTPDGAIGGLVLPGSSSIDPGGLVLQGDVGPSSGMPGIEGFDDAIPDPGFTFDDDGNLIDLTEINELFGTLAAVGGAAMPSDAGMSARVRQEHEEGLRAGAQQLGDEMEFDLPVFGDELPEGEAFPMGPGGSSDVLGSDPTVVASARRKKRAARTMPADATVELRNKDLADWNVNYLKNMKEASRIRKQLSLCQQAKKNAEYYVWGVGIGGVASRLQGTTGSNLFEFFMGDNLFELFTGINRHGVAGTKRDRDSGIDDVTQEEARRVRQRTGEHAQDFGRGQEDEITFIPGGDEVELPREAQSPLDDRQVFSSMPWNITASVRGSSAIPRSGRVGALSSLKARRGTRMISTSPLHGRGKPDGPQALGGFEETDNSFDNFGGFEGFSSDMPEAALAEPVIRDREALPAEGENFIVFISDAIDKKHACVKGALEPTSNVLQADAASETDEVLFQNLIPPMENNKMVASQALMIILTLGTKGLLNVRQDEEFAEIGLSLTVKARAAQNVDSVPGHEDQEEEGDIVEEEQMGSQCEELFATGREVSETDEAGDDDNSIQGD